MDAVEEDPPLYQEKRDQHPPDASVAVEKRVDCLELHVREARPDDRGDPVPPSVQKAL